MRIYIASSQPDPNYTGSASWALGGGGGRGRGGTGHLMMIALLSICNGAVSCAFTLPHLKLTQQGLLDPNYNGTA